MRLDECAKCECYVTCSGEDGTLEGRSKGSLMHSDSVPSGLCCIGCCCSTEAIGAWQVRE